jgi:hypothetical protein
MPGRPVTWVDHRQPPGYLAGTVSGALTPSPLTRRLDNTWIANLTLPRAESVTVTLAVAGATVGQNVIEVTGTSPFWLDVNASLVNATLLSKVCVRGRGAQQLRQAYGSMRQCLDWQYACSPRCLGLRSLQPLLICRWRWPGRVAAGPAVQDHPQHHHRGQRVG